ncbi:MAG TPA: FtsX-like permease family protein [Acidimicrobiales bacterium]
MGAVRFAFLVGLRTRWRSWLGMAVLIAVVGGFVLASLAAGRRTADAFPAFVAAHGYDAIVYASRPVPPVAKLPGVSTATEVVIPDTGQMTCACSRQIPVTGSGVVVVPPKAKSPFKLVSGRLPDPSAPDEVLASFTLQQDMGVRVGTVIHVPFEAPSQASAYNNANVGLPTPEGPDVALRVVGIEASEGEFPSGGVTVYELYPGPAFARSVLPRTAVDYQYLVRLRTGVAGLSRFDTETAALDLGTGSVGESNQDGQAASVAGSIHPQAVGWWILAALAGLVGLAVIGQSIARQSSNESEEYPVMAAIGASRWQFEALAMARNLVVGVAGAAGAVLVATLLSPLAPLGEARTAEISTGLRFDTLVLTLGAGAIVVVVLALGVWPAIRSARSWTGHPVIPSRPSAMVTYLAASGAPPSAVIGVSNALERRAGGTTTPLVSAVLGMILAVIALCGTGVFGASLSHLTATPELWGDPEQLSIQPPNPALLASLEHNPAVTGITTGVGAGEILINQRTVGAIAAAAVRGHLLFSNVDGHLPSGDHEIGLGVTTMRQVGAHLGSDVVVTVTLHSGRQRSLPFRVVSQDSFPELGGFVSLGTGALVTTAGLLRAVCPPSPQQGLCHQQTQQNASNGIRVSFVSGPRGQTAIRHYLTNNPSAASVPVTPTSLVNFGEAVNFPLIFGAMLAVFGAATLLHLLVVSVARRRREVGLLKVLGFVNRQIISSVAWQATTLALVGIVIGIPLGVVLGRATWNLFANNLGVVPVAVVPAWIVGLLAVGVVVVANVLAVTPALAATRSRPARLLQEA